MKNKSLVKSLVVVLMAVLLCLVAAFGFSGGYTANAESQSNTIKYFGTVVPCGKDNGYKPNTSSSWNPWTMLTIPGLVMGLIPDDNPHKGWSLGSFYVEGYSGSTESTYNDYGKNMPVYLKNVGDTVEFGFKLDQDINKLNGKSSLSIADDHKIIQDCWIEDPYIKGDFGHGVLVVVHTDYQGKQKISTYRDFLKGKSVGANTTVELFEEGDYRVILCYEIYKDNGWNWITDWMDPNGSWFAYRIESYFSVRNGNAMVYPFDLGSGGELLNKSFTEVGFRVDLANSHYLKLFAKKEILDDNGTDIVEDTRFNKIIADKSEFKDEGKYTITVSNIYTGLSTEKVIYVGSNDVMRCNTVTGYSISKINSMLADGYVINDDGTIAKPYNNVGVKPVIPSADGNAAGEEEFNWWMVAAIALGVMVVCAGIVVIVKKLIG